VSFTLGGLTVHTPGAAPFPADVARAAQDLTPRLGQGPEGSPYHACIFFVDFHFQSDHPFKPPRVRWLTPIFHPWISCEGRVCLYGSVALSLCTTYFSSPLYQIFI
jgi:hypothetical protein